MRSKIYFPEQASETFEEVFEYRLHPLRFSVCVTHQKERKKVELPKFY